MILDFWKKSVENSKLNSKLRYQFTMRVLGRSPRRRGCSDSCLNPGGRLSPSLLLKNLGFTLVGTQGTADFYNSNGIKCEVVNKIGAGRPDVVDLIAG